ncbi:hypothetical protein GE21DRAFT_1052532 [Neurospora crassa]|nr:hypothetical protein GE21DRAFT_1052532 [Neurospora crassa]
MMLATLLVHKESTYPRTGSYWCNGLFFVSPTVNCCSLLRIWLWLVEAFPPGCKLSSTKTSK